ncbi:MAG TPA: hypothetical protein VIX13_01970, partial [Candidatus Eisenbacteria bacterium]
MTSASARPGTQPVHSLAEVPEPAVRAWIEEALRRPETLGLLLCGSRVTGWAEPDGDTDGFLYITEAHYRSLDVEQTEVRLTAEGEIPRRLIGDFSLFSDAALEEQLRSPLDIDHWPYVDA